MHWRIFGALKKKFDLVINKTDLKRVRRRRMRVKVFHTQCMEALIFYFHAISNLTRFFYALRFVDASDEPL